MSETRERSHESITNSRSTIKSESDRVIIDQTDQIEVNMEGGESNENSIMAEDNQEDKLEPVDEHEVQIVKIVPLPHARSEVWSYFGFVADNDGLILDRTKVVCKLCASTFCYSGNTTNFYSHLKSMHSDIQLRTSITPKQRNMKRPYSMMDDADSEMYNNSLLNDTEDDSIPSRSQQDLVFVEDITEAIVDFIVADCRPIAVIQGKGFQRLLRLLAPGYIIPDKQKLIMAVRKKYDQMRKEREMLTN